MCCRSFSLGLKRGLSGNVLKLFVRLVQLLEATEAFHLSIAKDIQSVEHAVADQCMNSRPQCSWTFDGITGSFVVSASEKPLKATLWYAYTIPRNGRRDFRWLTADLGNW